MDNRQKSLLDIANLRWLRWFITPRQMPETFIEQQEARRLTFFLFLVAISSIFNFLVWMLNGQVSPFPPFGLVLGISLYSITRFFHYKTVATITSIVMLIMPYVLYMISPIDVYPLIVFFLLMLSLLIASQFLSLRANLQIGILVFITAYFMNNIIIARETMSLLAVLVTFTILTILMILNAYGRDRLKQFAHQNENPTQAIFFQNALNLIPDAAFIQVDKAIIEVNDAATYLLGLSRSEIMGQSASRFISTGTSTSYKLDSNADNLTVRYDDLLHAHKGEQAVHITASSITYVDTSATLFVIRPHQASADNHSLLQNIIDASFNSIVVTDTDLDEGPHIVMVNPAFCNMTGYKEAELIGRTPRILQGKETNRDILDKVRLALESGATEFRSETTNYRKDGTKFRVLWLIRPVYNSNGKLTHYLSVQQEITQQEQLQRDLWEREANLSIISEVMTDYAYMLEVTPENTLQFAWMTGAVEAITGLSYEEAMLLGDWHRIIHEDDQHFYELRTKTLLYGQTNTLEYRIRHQDGSIRWIQDKAHPIIDDTSGKTIRILGAAHDVTERVESQETLKTYVVQQAIIAELGLLALHVDSIDMLLDHSCDLCEQVLEVDFISILEHRPDENLFACLKLSDDSAPFVTGDTFSDNAAQSLAGYTLNHNEAVVSHNLDEERRFTPLPRITDNTYKSAIGVVILGQGAPYGVLTAFSKLPNYFAHDDIYFLQAIANILGTFIVRSQAQLAEKEQREFAEALRDATSVINSRLELPEVLNKIIIYLQQVVPQTQQATIMLLKQDTRLYQHYTTWGFAENALERRSIYAFSLDEFPLLKLMNETKEPLYIFDTTVDERWIVRDSVRQTRSYLGAPIIVDDETIGFINLHGFEVGVFSNEDALRLKTFADKTSTAIVNARKQEDLEHKVKQRTAELRQEREQLEAILSGTGDGIYYTEQDRIAFVNDALCKLTGYSAEEMLGSHIKIFVPSDVSPEEMDKLRALYYSFSEGGVWRDKVRIQRKDGTSFEAGLTISSFGSEDTGVKRAVTIMRDLSREKELEDLKRTFIAAAAHDLRSPISSLKMRMFMIKREPEKIDHHLERVNEIINHVNHLVNDLLDAHGRIVLRPQNIILQDVLDKVVDRLSLEAEEKGLAYKYHPMNEPALILADENRLTQVFTNLITNAIHYTEAKGCITVTTRLNDAEKTVAIEVQDTGIGIPLEEQESIFLPFYRTQGNESKGNGLGLSITREIIELHGGEVTVESIAEQGSTFIVTLPLSKID